jgi:hypothetical protein
MALTANQKYLLNKLNNLAKYVRLGDIIDAVEKGTDLVAGSVAESKIAVQSSAALNVQRVCIGLFDASGDVGNRTIAAHNASVDLPAKAIVTRVYSEVITTFTSATDAATIALSIEGAGDVKAALAISNGANFWDAGLHDCLQAGAAANFIKLTAARKIVATVAVEALTAGKMAIYAEYILGL